MNYHRTPQSVISILAQHVPKSAKTILEPAVGEGALLEALYCNQLGNGLTLIDIDSSRLDAIRIANDEILLISADFISWSLDNYDNKYDLIITNPPFSARPRNWIDHKNKKLPIELVFFQQCINLLQEGGTLLAIVPDTLVNSSRLQNERKRFFLEGAFIYVYQLPARSFSNIEGVFYLLVFKKGVRQSYITLRNTKESADIKITPEKFSRFGYRLDYSFYQNSFLLDKLTSLSTQSLATLCKIGRGPIRNDYKNNAYIHSNTFQKDAWRSYLDFSREKLCIGVKRVSRNAHLSFGLFPEKSIPISTDCIIFIRPYTIDVFEVLFFLKTFFSNDTGKTLLLKGAGAKFIQVDALKKLPYFDLRKEYKSEFSRYKNSYLNFDFSTCKEIERSVYASFCLRSNISSANDSSSRADG